MKVVLNSRPTTQFPLRCQCEGCKSVVHLESFADVKTVEPREYPEPVNGYNYWQCPVCSAHNKITVNWPRDEAGKIAKEKTAAKREVLTITGKQLKWALLELADAQHPEAAHNSVDARIGLYFASQTIDQICAGLAGRFTANIPE